MGCQQAGAGTDEGCSEAVPAREGETENQFRCHSRKELPLLGRTSIAGMMLMEEEVDAGP